MVERDEASPKLGIPNPSRSGNRFLEAETATGNNRNQGKCLGTKLGALHTLSALMWLAVIIILPILGPIAFLLYVTRQQEIETQASARDENDTVEETL